MSSTTQMLLLLLLAIASVQSQGLGLDCLRITNMISSQCYVAACMQIQCVPSQQRRQGALFGPSKQWSCLTWTQVSISHSYCSGIMSSVCM